MITKRFLTFFGVLLFLAACVASATGQDADISQKRITIKMEKQALGTVFRYLMKNYDIPIGLEQSLLDRDHSEYSFDTNMPESAQATLQSQNDDVKIQISATKTFRAQSHPISIDVENETLELVFDEIVKQMVNYDWEVSDGVVNIYPSKGRDSKFRDLMYMEIAGFTIEKGQKVEDLTTNIRSLPEFRKFLKTNELDFTGVRSGVNVLVGAQYGRILDKEARFERINFRSLLNGITKIKRGGWVLKYKMSVDREGINQIDLDI